MRYNNYHKHDHYGNPWISDVVVKPENYIKRAQELGHTTVFTTNHGVTGSIFDWLTQTKDTDLKLVYGMEAYFVRSYDADEDGKRDRSNKHLIIIAMNNDGVMQLNDIMSTAHGEGFYYRARVDADRLFSLNPRDFVITSACVAGIWDDPELLLACKRHFGDNFFLELQPHNIDLQKTVNQQMLEFSRSAGIPIIHANDSHYIYPGDKNYREIYLRGHDMFYKDDNAVESDMILDYPDDDTILERYERQGILTRSEAELALHNTLVFDNCEKITLINDDIKLPQISKTPNEDLKKIINDRWLEERKSIPKDEWPKYLEAIREEVKVVEDTHMANYFLIDYNVAKSAQEEFGGRLTNTGRGSAPSFYITKMLGLTDIDRVDAPITLFPSRFMSVERILGSRSLPDIDLNTADRVPFIKATKKLLGEENCEWMLSWKPLQAASAFRLYCKGSGMEISEYDSVAKDLDSYRDDPKWKDIIKGSERFIGVIDSVSESPCSMLLYDKSVRKEIGLVRTSKGVLCCMLDGYNCDKYKYLKNDYLTVTIWAIIKDVCELANIPIPTIRELDNLLDDKTYKIYEDGITCTINQADSEFGTGIAMRYKPHSVSDMSAFVAILRPGCASLLQDFADRKPYTTGVPELDDLLTEGSHRMIYQELIMKYLIWLGIPETGSYDIIKKIAKKKFKEPELKELKDKLLAGWVNRVGKEDGFKETWDVVEDAARYSFNASHSLSYAYDSLYGAYLKSHYPLEYYTVALNYYSGDETRTMKLTQELSYFGIKLKPIKFRLSQAGYSLSREDNSIYKGIGSIKHMSAQAAQDLYELRDKKYNSFIELLADIKNCSVDSRQLKILINLNFFEEFGEPNYLLNASEIFYNFPDKQISKERLEVFHVNDDDVRPLCLKETAKMFSQYNKIDLVTEIVKHAPYHKRTLKEDLDAQNEYLGYFTVSGEQYRGIGYVKEVDTKYSPKLKVYGLKRGEMFDCKIDKKTFNKNKLNKGDLIRITGQITKPKSRLIDGKWEPIPDTSDLWITKYQVVNM